MAFSVNTPIGDGSTKQFAVNFTNGIFSRDSVHVFVEGEVDGAGDPVERTFTWINDGLIELDGDAPASGLVIEIRRIMDKDEPAVDFEDGEILTEETMDRSVDHLLNALHELLDGYGFGSIQTDINMNGNRVVGLGEPQNPDDAARVSDIAESASAAVLRQELGSSDDGSNLVAHAGTANTVTETLDQNIDAINQRVIYAESVADMVAGGFSIGASVETLGYYSPGDGGGNQYAIVEGATGTDDGGSFIDLANGNQAKGLFITDQNEKQWGKTSFGDVDSVLYRMKKGETIKVVCLGDSITAGVLDAGGTATTPYPDRLAALLQQFYQNINITVVNAGISGNTSQNMIDRFATDVRAEAPDLIIFNAGTNDSREVNGVSVDAFSENVLTILGLCQPTPTVVMGITPRFKEHETENGEGVIGYYRSALERMAKLRRVPYLDMYSALLNVYKSRAYGASQISSDGSHYSEEGYKIIGDYVFAKGLANDDLFIKPGEFKDARGQWIITDPTASSWSGTSLQDANSLLIANDQVRLYLYLDDYRPCSLITHVVIDRTNTTDQRLTINSQTVAGASREYFLSPQTAAAANWFANDYPINTVKLAPGLNNIVLSATTGSAEARVNGFSVREIDADFYLESHVDSTSALRAKEYFGSLVYEASAQNHKVIGDGVRVLSNNGDYVTRLAEFVPDFDGVTTRWRIRATVVSDCSFYFGQQSDGSGIYKPVFRLLFTGSAVEVYTIDFSDTERLTATTSFTVGASPGRDVYIDITTARNLFTVWVNGTQVHTENIPLSIGPVFMRNANSTGRMYSNPPIKKGNASSDTSAVISEKYITFTDDNLHLVSQDGTNKTVTFT